MSKNTEGKAMGETFLCRAVAFMPNRGQFDPRVEYFAQTGDSRVFFLADKIVFDFAGPLSEDGRLHERAAVAMLFDGGDSDGAPKGVDPCEGVVNFYIGNDPANWKSAVSTYQKLLYQEVWPGIDLLVGSDGRELKFNWIVRPDGDPNKIILRYLGADALEVDHEGNLLVRHALGTMKDAFPMAFQERENEKSEVECAFLLGPSEDMSVGFQVGPYDKALPLCIDPAVSFTTFLGGTDFDIIYGLTVDSQGNAYYVGQTVSSDFPVTPGAYQGALAGSANAFVTKMASDGTSLIYSTYLGGDGVDSGLAIVNDPSGAAYLTGSTTSTTFPTQGAYQGALAGTQDAFVTKLSPNGGALIFSTYLGGATGDTTGRGIAINMFGQTYVAGETSSSSFPTSGGYSNTYNGGASDGFVSLLSSGGGSLLASTFLGGALEDVIYGLAVDHAGYVCVAGKTYSSDFPTTTGAYQTSLTGAYNAVVTKLVEDLSDLSYSTYLGGTAVGSASALAVDSDNQVCVVGITYSNDFPTTPGAYQTVFGGVYDAFVTKFSVDGGSLVFSTYLGGTDADSANSVAIDSSGHIWVAGDTSSADFPTTPLVISSSLTGTEDWFVSMLSEDATELLVSYYRGGGTTQQAKGIEVSQQGAVYVAGGTSSSDFPVTVGAYQTTYGGGTSDGAAEKMYFATFQNASLTVTKLN